MSEDDVIISKTKDTLVKQFKLYLNEIELQMDDLKYKLTNGIDIVKEHCGKVRADIKHAIFETIQKVNQVGEHMLQQVDEYEETCFVSYDMNKANYTLDYDNLLAEMDFYNKQWESHMKQFNVDYNQMAEANLGVRDLKKRSIEEKKRFNHMLFNKKLLKYEKCSQNKLLGILGSLKYENLDKNTKTIFAKHILSDYNKTNPNYLVFDQLENDNFYILYQTNSEQLRSFYLDSSGQVTDQHSYTNHVVQFKKYKDMIFLNYIDSRGYYYLQSLTLKLKDLHSICFFHALGKSFDHPCSLISVNETKIFLIQAFSNQIRIFNRKFHYVKSIGQTCNASKPFYFPKNLNQFESRNDRYYWLNNSQLNIVNENNGHVINSIPVETSDKFFFDSADNVYMFDRAKLWCYNWNGMLIRKIEIFDVCIGSSLFLDKNDNVVLIK